MSVDPINSVGEKVAAIFAELAGDRAKRLDGCVIAEPAMSTIAAAFVENYGELIAADIGFHMADWNSNAAFIVAIHLFPERFTKEEVEAGVGLFLSHALNHIRAACKITGYHVRSRGIMYGKIFPIKTKARKQAIEKSQSQARTDSVIRPR